MSISEFHVWNFKAWMLLMVSHIHTYNKGRVLVIRITFHMKGCVISFKEFSVLLYGENYTPFKVGW